VKAGFELFVARKYLTARRKQAFISVITFVSVLGVTIGVMALVIALSLITGFQEDVQEKILGATSHLMISDLAGEGLQNYQELAARIETLPRVQAVTPVVYNTVLITGPARSAGALLKGMDFRREREVADWLSNCLPAIYRKMMKPRCWFWASLWLLRWACQLGKQLMF